MVTFFFCNRYVFYCNRKCTSGQQGCIPEQWSDKWSIYLKPPPDIVPDGLGKHLHLKHWSSRAVGGNQKLTAHILLMSGFWHCKVDQAVFYNIRKNTNCHSHAHQWLHDRCLTCAFDQRIQAHLRDQSRSRTSASFNWLLGIEILKG